MVGMVACACLRGALGAGRDNKRRLGCERGGHVRPEDFFMILWIYYVGLIQPYTFVFAVC